MAPTLSRAVNSQEKPVYLSLSLTILPDIRPGVTGIATFSKHSATTDQRTPGPGHTIPIAQTSVLDGSVQSFL